MKSAIASSGRALQRSLVPRRRLNHVGRRWILTDWDKHFLRLQILPSCFAFLLGGGDIQDVIHNLKRQPDVLGITRQPF